MDLPKLYSTINEVDEDLRTLGHAPAAAHAAADDSHDDKTAVGNPQMAGGGADDKSNKSPPPPPPSSSTTSSSSIDPPHLFLHFDVNETILIGDPAGGDSVEECLNKIIAKSAFVSTRIVDLEEARELNGTGVQGTELNSRGEKIDGERNEKEKKLQRSPSSGNVTSLSGTHHLEPTHWWNGLPLVDATSNNRDAITNKPPPLYTGWTWPSQTCPYYRTSYKKHAKKFTEMEHGRVYKPLYEELCQRLGLQKVEKKENGKRKHEGETNDVNVEEESGKGNGENVFENFVPAFFYTLQHYFPSQTKKAEINNVVESPVVATTNTATATTSGNKAALPKPPKVTLVLRTFGTDLPRVITCISEFARGHHPSFPEYYNPDLILDNQDSSSGDENDGGGSLFCSAWRWQEKELIYELHPVISDETSNPSYNNRTRQHNTSTQYPHLCGDHQILNYLQTKTIVGIQDCYPFWRDAHHAPWAGKPVWARCTTTVTPTAPTSNCNKEGSVYGSVHNHHHILLDDNIHNDPNDGAGGIRIPLSSAVVVDESTSVVQSNNNKGSDDDHVLYESLHGKEALDMHGKHLIRVPTIRPLLEEDWFVRRIEEARERWLL